MTTSNHQPIIVSGIQPSGQVHLGNYLGALKNWRDIQNSGRYDCYFFIADYHSLTEDYEPKEKQEQILDLAATFFALGLNQDQATIFLQSQVPQCAELAWIFNTLTPIGELERMTQFKDKSRRQVKNINTGLLTYPILQAADILLYKGEFVPVGQDQVQHVEITSDTAKWFNRKYQVKYFPEVKPLLTATPKIMSLVSPESKMSKSLGDKHYIGIDEDLASIKNKLAKAVSTPEGIKNLRAIYDAFSEKMKGDFNDKSMAQTKETIASGIADYFADFREQKAALKKDKEKLLKLLQSGQEKAMGVAQKNIQEIKKIIGVDLS